MTSASAESRFFIFIFEFEGFPAASNVFVDFFLLISVSAAINDDLILPIS